MDTDLQFPQKVTEEDAISTPNSLSSGDRMHTDGDHETIQHAKFLFDRNQV